MLSCCGIRCEKCEYWGSDCKGCDAENGRPFWLQYTGADICGIFTCCRREKQYAHCGQCAKLPCELYDHLNDSTKSAAENARILREQLKLLKLCNI